MRLLPVTRPYRAVATFVAVSAPALAQSVEPPFLTSIGGPTCSGTAVTENVRIRLPSTSTSVKIDVFLLFDDTGSFASQVPEVTATFQRVVAELGLQLPIADVAFGVGRFEDFGGLGTGFSQELPSGRPFTLNQAILSRSAPTFLSDINAALANTGPGFGGDQHETSVGEGLFQLATGVGFDGDGNGSSLDSGPAGALSTQVSPGNSGDVPPFSSYVGSSSGTIGGGGFREDSLRIVLLATDFSTVAPFDAALGFPPNIVGTGSTEPTSALVGSTNLGERRYGYVSDSKSLAGNTIPNAVAPLGAATIPMSIAAANAAGLRVIGLAPGGAPTTSTQPSEFASTMLSAVARLTGAVDSNGDPLVFDTTDGANAISLSIVDAVIELALAEKDLSLVAEDVPAGLVVTTTPSVVTGVGPGGAADFQVTFAPTAGYEGGSFALRFRDQASGGAVGTLPVTFECLEGCAVVDFETAQPANGQQVPIGTAFGNDVSIGGLSASGHHAALFDSDPAGPNATSSDPDLLVDSGNVLILQENGALASPGVYSSPDDDWLGGLFSIQFVAPTEVCAIDLVDIDLIDVMDARVTLTDERGRVRIFDVPGGYTEDVASMSGTGIRRLGLGTTAPQQGFLAVATATESAGFDGTRVVQMDVELNGSGAIDNLLYMPPAAPIVLGGFGAQAKRRVARR